MRFILNDKIIETLHPDGMTLLDFIRYKKHLVGTKIGCREGDCGACTILIGELKDGHVHYKSMTSCITPLANAEGKHVVTIEGLNLKELSPVQQAMLEAGATQCGFCTVGFVVSLTGYCMTTECPTLEGAISAVDGNICRCTGYKSIERAIESLVIELNKSKVGGNLTALFKNGYLPDYFQAIEDKLITLSKTHKSNGQAKPDIIVGGGTDLYVQRHEELQDIAVYSVFDHSDLNGIKIENGTCVIGGACTVTDLMASEEIKKLIPNLYRYLKLVSSTPIRNMGTIAGNIVNASPIGDLTIFFLALDANLTIRKGDEYRKKALREFYSGYKTYDLNENEIIVSVEFNTFDSKTLFNFEKVSKRTYLDIASVNSAIQLKLDGNTIEYIHLSAGGVGPTPMYLKETSEYLIGKELSIENVQSAIEVMNNEITPISDARGTVEYKKLLLRQLFYAHFIQLFPTQFEMEVLQ